MCVERGHLNKPSALRNYGNVNELFVFPIEQGRTQEIMGLKTYLQR